MGPQVWASEPRASKGRPPRTCHPWWGCQLELGRFGACKPAFVSLRLKHTKPLLDPCGVLSVAVEAHTGWGLKTKSGTTKWKGGERKRNKIQDPFVKGAGTKGAASF